VEFLVAFLALAVLALGAFGWSLSARLARIERRLAEGALPVDPGKAGQASTEAAQHRTDGPPRISPTFGNIFEQLIGGRLLIWVGGVALVVAAVFLIRYSIDLGLITPAMRMIAAGLFGALLLALGEWAYVSPRLADDRRVSQALVGAGLAVLYATVYGSYYLYAFIGINTASVLMLMVTAAALAQSLRHGPGTAALGLIGGFLTPWLVGDPHTGALPLLFYLALLDAAVFAIAWRRRWPWLAAVAVLASFAWTGFLLARPVEDALLGGCFALGLGIVAGLMKPAGSSLAWLQPVAIAGIELAILIVRHDVDGVGWVLFDLAVLAALATARIKQRPPFDAFVLLALALLLLPVRKLFGDLNLAAAASAFTLLFGLAALVVALERRSGWWAMLASLGFAGPVLVMRQVSPDLLDWTAWGGLQALLALGPLGLAVAGRARQLPGIMPALTAAAMLALAVVDLSARDTLSIGWIVLSVAFIAGGMMLRDRAVRLAGLALVTLTVLKMFLVDAAALEGVLRILSFLGLAISLIVLGRFYGTLLRAERAAS
jgi:uncharacterized membrane protein